MRPELPTNLESMLLRPRREGGYFSFSKQEPATTDFATLLGTGAPAHTAPDGLPAALPMLPAGDILPPGGKPLPERRVPPSDASAMPAPEPGPGVEVDAGTGTGPLARMLEAGDADPVPAGTPPAVRRDAQGAVSAGTPDGEPVDAPAAMPAVAPASVSPLTGSPDSVDVTTNVATRAVPVAAPALPPDASRTTGAAGRVAPPPASNVAGDTARPLPANSLEAVPDVPGRSRPVLPENPPAPLPDDAGSPAESAARSARDALAPVPAAPPVPRPGQPDVPVRSRPAVDAGLSIDRLPTVPTGIEQGVQAGTAPTRTADLPLSGTAAPARDAIGVPVQDPAWDSALSERVVMMSRDQRHSAELRLSPADLGPLRVQLSVEDGKADVSFHVQHGVTREAIEQALPRLREMLADNGLQLGRCDVGDAGTQDRAAGRDARPLPAGSPGTGEAEEPTVSGETVRTSRGLIDTFA